MMLNRADVVRTMAGESGLQEPLVLITQMPEAGLSVCTLEPSVGTYVTELLHQDELMVTLVERIECYTQELAIELHAEMVEEAQAWAELSGKGEIIQ